MLDALFSWGCLQMIIELAISPEEAAKRIEFAVGQDRLRVSAPLTGRVSGLTFRVTLPPGVFNHPYEPVVSGVIEPRDTECHVIVKIIHPWLTHLAVFTALPLMFSLLKEDITSLAISFLIWGGCVVGCLFVRRLQIKELKRKLCEAFTHEAI